MLKPYVSAAPKNIVPLLILDSYKCHMIESIVTKITDLGVEVEHIPGGCTCLCQPVDVGINKPFKCALRSCWQAWMMEEAVMDGKTTSPSRMKIAQWCVAALPSLTEEKVKNAWRHGDYSWFPVAKEDNNDSIEFAGV